MCGVGLCEQVEFVEEIQDVHIVKCDFVVGASLEVVELPSAEAVDGADDGGVIP